MDPARLAGPGAAEQEVRELFVEDDGRRRLAPGLRECGEILDEGRCAKIGGPPAVGAPEEREGIIEQVRELLEGHGALDVRWPQSGLGHLLDLHEARGLQQGGPLVLAREQVVDDQRVDELAGELGP